jgi:hypothetical protein
MRISGKQAGSPEKYVPVTRAAPGIEKNKPPKIK